MEELEVYTQLSYEDVVADLVKLVPRMYSGVSALQVAWIMGRSNLPLPSAAMFCGNVSTHDQDGRPNIMALPEGTTLQILSKLDYLSLIRAVSTCRTFRKQWSSEDLHQQWFQDRLVVRDRALGNGDVVQDESRGVDARQMWPGLFVEGVHSRPWFEATMRAEAWRRVCRHHDRPPVPSPDWSQAKRFMRVKKVKCSGRVCTFCRVLSGTAGVLMPWGLCCLKCWTEEGFHYPVTVAQNIYGIGQQDDKGMLKGRRFLDPLESKSVPSVYSPHASKF